MRRLKIICWVVAALTSGAGLAATSEAVAEGGQSYLAHCARCHQADGSGLQPLYPALRGSEALRAEPARAIRAVLAGRHGVTAMDDAFIDGVMPAHGDLANETIADILNYIVQDWKTAEWSVTAADVAAERREILQGAAVEHPTVSFETSSSAIADLDMTPYVTGKGPAMTVHDYRLAMRTYFTNCTSCHGVMRQGLPGVPLTPDIMRQRGSEYLRAVMNYGATVGMPNWGTAESLSSDEIARLARFLQHPVPRPPDFGAKDIQASWQLPSPVARRSNREPGELFAVAMHDTGQVAFIDRAKREVVSVVDTGLAPHLMRASASGRYVYALSRGGWVTLIDTYGAKPMLAARVRVGFEARALDVSRFQGFEDSYVMAASYWPPQAVLLDGRTLEPQRVLSTPSAVVDSDRSHPAPRITDVLGSVQRPDFITVVKDTGRLHVIPYDKIDSPIQELDAFTNLRAGSLEASGRYFVVPADRERIAVVDTKSRQLVAVTTAPRIAGGGRGANAVDPYYGPVWVTSSMAGNRVTLLGADPVGHAQFAWEEVRSLEAAGGSLTATAHPRSNHLWVDAPFADDREARGQVTVFDLSQPESDSRTLPIAEWAGVKGTRLRTLQPVFSNDGREVWILVWNESSESSAIVIVDDETLEKVAVVRDNRLVTPTRLLAVP